MRTIVTAAISAALVALAFLFFWPKPPAPPDPGARLATLEKQVSDLGARILAGPIDVTVNLTRVGTSCQSQTLPQATASRTQRVRWHIVNNGCTLAGREIEIRFAQDNSPLDVRRPRHGRFIQTRVRGDAAAGQYKYSLWAVGAAGDFQLEDPELQISEF